MRSNDCEVVHVDKSSFRPQENDEELLGSEVPYLSVISTNVSC